MNKNLKAWGAAGWAATLALSLGLAGCGGSNNDSTSAAALRVVNATNSHPSLDLLVGSVVSASATATDTASAYVAPAAGSNLLQLNDAGAGTALSTTNPTLSASAHYTLFAYESGGSVKTTVLNEDQTAPAAGSAYLRVYNVADAAGKLDVYITDPATDLAAAGSPISLTAGTVPYSTAYALQGAGTWRVRVTGYGNKADLRLDMPLVLASQQVATVVLSPSVGGVLLNGSTLIQQSTYSATRNTNVRLRLAAAVSGRATVAASAGSTVIDAGSVAPAFGYYTLVPAGSALNISVASASVGAPATPLVAGSDMTLLVYGDAASPTATLLTDDNRPPTDTTTIKMRLINGVTGAAGALTLTANNALVASRVAPGTASTPVAVLGSTNAMNLTVTSSNAPGTFLSNTGTIFNSGGVYTVLVDGDASAPGMLIQ